MVNELPSALGAVHRRRLREVWRSAGWPCQDLVEVELLAAGWLERVRDGDGRETLRVTDAGIQVLAATLHRNRAARDAHEALVARVATEMQRAGRVVWRGLSLRAPVAAELAGPEGQVLPVTRWAMAMPDVYSIRHTTVEDHVEPIVHEVKVRRADLLADLKRPAKGEAYRALCGECWYVLKAGIGRAEEIPEVYGVMVAHPAVGERPQADNVVRPPRGYEQSGRATFAHERPQGRAAPSPPPAGDKKTWGGPAFSCEAPAFGALEVLRPAPKRAFRLPFALWMALARAHPLPPDDDPPQALLRAGPEAG